MGKYILTLELELNDAYRLVHLGYDGVVVVIVGVRIGLFGHKAVTWVVAVGLHREHGERTYVYAVAVLQKIIVVVAQAYTHGIGYAASVSRRGAHPEYIVIAPLYIDVALLFKLVYYEMRTVSAVIDVSDYVQLVYNGVLYEVAHCDNELVGAADIYYRIYDLVVVFFLVEILAAGGHKLCYDIFKVLGQSLAHL